MKNRLGYLGLLGIVGLLGIFTENRGYLGFFGFCSYFRYFTVIPDELFQENVRKASTPAFFASLGASAVTLMCYGFWHNIEILKYGFAIGFIVSILVFSILLNYAEFQEGKES